MPDAQPFCYPVCLFCRTAPCPKAFIPPPPPQPYKYPSANALRAFLKCGCEEDLGSLQYSIFGAVKIFCKAHGWQRIRRGTIKRTKNGKTESGQMDLPPF